MNLYLKGKIGRLPEVIREEVNVRLRKGEPGKRLVAWLNELPEVRALLAEEFGGAAIKEQNLTNWKQGGFREWRMEREARNFIQPLAERQPQAEQQLRPTTEQKPAVTLDDLTTIVAVRYLTVVREWQQSPMPMERRWRQMREILQDVLKLQRGGQREQRLELDWERLEFAKERFEDEKQSGGGPSRATGGSDLPSSEPGWQVPGVPQETFGGYERQATLFFLVAARQWPEVQEALAGAFRLFHERKEAAKEANEAESGSIKGNQGGKNLKNEGTQTELANCSPSPVSCPPGRGDDLARFRVQECITTSTAMGETRTEWNKTESGSIKGNQGGLKITNAGMQKEVAGCPGGCGVEPSPPREMQVELVNGARAWSGRLAQSAGCAGMVCRSATHSTSTGPPHQRHPFWNFESDPVSITLPALI